MSLHKGILNISAARFNVDQKKYIGMVNPNLSIQVRTEAGLPAYYFFQVEPDRTYQWNIEKYGDP